MAVLFSPWGNQQFLNDSGNAAVGWKIYSYAAGSSTPLATYTDSAGGTPQSNPIVLDSLGFPTVGQIWLTSGLSYKLVLTDASGVVKKTEDNITGVTGTSSVTQWQASGLTPTYVSATSFTLSGDQTSEFQPGRRLQTTNTSGTIYSTIVTSAYGALTTVTVVNDSGVLDSGLSQVSYGFLTATNSSVPVTAPVFRAYASASQSITNNVETKLNLNTESYDSHGYFDATTNYRFTPLEAGYYRISGLVRFSAAAAIGIVYATIYKNGTSYSRGQEFININQASGAVSIDDEIFFNGTSDYIELWGLVNGTTPIFQALTAAVTSRLTGSFIRSA